MQLTSNSRQGRSRPSAPPPPPPPPPIIEKEDGLRGGAFIAMSAAFVAWAIFVVALVFAAGGPAR